MAGIINHATSTLCGSSKMPIWTLCRTPFEIVVERVSAKEDFPGVTVDTVDTDEGEHYVIGDGATAIKGGAMRSSGGLLGKRPTSSGTTATCPSARPALSAELRRRGRRLRPRRDGPPVTGGVP
jgi:hypothetical protein